MGDGTRRRRRVRLRGRPLGGRRPPHLRRVNGPGNPRPLDRIRTDATAVLGRAHLVALYAHNTNTASPHFSPGAVMIAEDFGPVYNTNTGMPAQSTGTIVGIAVNFLKP